MVSTDSHPAPAVLITGSAKRLGKATALHLAKHGWSIAIHYRTSEAEALQTVADCEQTAQAAGHTKTRFAAFQADLADETATRQLIPSVLSHFGSLSAVVNNASLFQEDTADNFSYATMQQHLASNTAAPVILAQLLHQHLQNTNAPARSGCVINMLDQKLWNQNPDFFSYTLSKAALEAANTMLALALKPLVRVVGIAPGLTLTSHMLDEISFEKLHQLSPLERSSTPEDIASAVQFALANQSITGTTLLVDGGQHLMKFERDFSLMV